MLLRLSLTADPSANDLLDYSLGFLLPFAQVKLVVCILFSSARNERYLP